jgi:hypothetical protein
MLEAILLSHVVHSNIESYNRLILLLAWVGSVLVLSDQTPDMILLIIFYWLMYE